MSEKVDGLTALKAARDEGVKIMIPNGRCFYYGCALFVHEYQGYRWVDNDDLLTNAELGPIVNCRERMYCRVPRPRSVTVTGWITKAHLDTVLVIETGELPDWCFEDRAHDVTLTERVK